MSSRLKPATTALILKLANANPTLCQHQIAALAGVNQGRVSALLHGRSRRRNPIRMTPAVAALIKKMANDNPTLYQHQIAALIGINQGRVSEVLRGVRFAHVPPAS
ncbi:hypothetical protein D3093_32765 (plasmid) [Azospirillum argentinense]|uniref:Uncharacterized protein n=1 Tax=Azospirillum argentinense TaxID=2970906 RepID=A0A4D8PRU7_9PROT|nr:hypothetical protein [Azospirillum argentinense]QCO00041.1 hypothetical protein D3093_32765 [Azospirillum argentinense]